MKYEYEDFTLVDMELVKELWDDGIRDPKDLQSELDFRDLSIETIIQIIDTLKHTKKITENKKESIGYEKIETDEFLGQVYGWTNDQNTKLPAYMIDDDIVSSHINKNFVEFTNEEVNRLSEYLSHIKNGEETYDIPYYSVIYGTYKPIRGKIYGQKRSQMYITKLVDEWYYIDDHGDSNRYYKCDQFEGVISYLNNKKNLKKISNMKNIKSFEAFSMQKDKCDRCDGSTNGITIMSMFNEDILCQKCKDDERSRGDYASASDADNMEIKKGNYNFKGIGYKK